MQTFWDPLNTTISTETVISQKADQDLLKKFHYYQEHPYNPKLVLGLAIIGTIGFWVIIIIAGLIGELGDPRLILCSFLPALLYYLKIQSLEKELTELVIAHDFDWIFDPTESTDRWQALAQRYPEIFNKGNRNQFIDNQFWGNVNGQSSFWLCRYTYTVGSGRYSTTSITLVYAFLLPHNAAADFVLSPQTGFLLDSIWHPTLTTESQDFNQKFHIVYKGNTNTQGMNIFEVLTPVAQEKLIEFRNQRGPFTLLFRDNVMLVMFTGDLMLHYTNFFRSVALDPRDATALKQNIEATIALGDAVLPCID